MAYGETESISHESIILGMLKKISEQTLTVVNSQNMISRVRCYRDSVLCLSDILLPFYDKEMEEAYEKYTTEYEKLMEETCINNTVKNNSEYTIGIKNLSRELFRELNLLLERNDYLKSSIYGDGDSSESQNVVEDIEEDSE